MSMAVASRHSLPALILANGVVMVASANGEHTSTSWIG
jgi:hypothetical protein